MYRKVCSSKEKVHKNWHEILKRRWRKLVCYREKLQSLQGEQEESDMTTVKKFLENGAKVAMLGSREETVQKALASLKEENPEYPVVGYWPNLTKHEEVKEVFEKVKEEFGISGCSCE